MPPARPPGSHWFASRRGARIAAYLAVTLLALTTVEAQTPFDRTSDRGAGIPVSMFGTYVAPGELLIYPFFEYYRDADAEYSPAELGFAVDLDYRGRYRASEGLLFIGYGLSDRLAVELEAAVIDARLEKAPDDTSALPAVIEESGLGDVEGQLRWRWNRETDRRPEVFSYFETVFPLQKTRLLIGTQHWEFKFGTGVVRGYRWGTLTVRAAVEYDGEENSAALGEYALEYLKDVSPSVQVFAGVEGSEDEVEGIAELQIALSRSVILKLNNAIGLTSKATDWAPELGILFRFR
jgi:hypothetical protein